uniref:Uncharacterized protein n=1 Tax=Nelumbo nucifera TaxID=4432 RepID=A0A822YXB4_NELNU|nr:TPA_asm: hypothetical protein HUJ06_006445 [Nelumbo nucifera]
MWKKSPISSAFYNFMNLFLLKKTHIFSNLVDLKDRVYFFFSAIRVAVVALAKVASEVKGADIRVLFVKPLVYWTWFFIIATAFSRPQIDAIGYVVEVLCV